MQFGDDGVAGSAYYAVLRSSHPAETSNMKRADLFMKVSRRAFIVQRLFGREGASLFEPSLSGLPTLIYLFTSFHEVRDFVLGLCAFFFNVSRQQ